VQRRIPNEECTVGSEELDCVLYGAELQAGLTFSWEAESVSNPVLLKI
jgi:hypothetical protein